MIGALQFLSTTVLIGCQQKDRIYRLAEFKKMRETRDFDLLNSPLEGTNLIEASAGTGKTYTIAGLFLRLVLEKNLSVNEILVVTFTEAATDELKERIRSKLREGMEVFSGGLSEDAFLNGLVNTDKDSKLAIGRLREALRAFDQAAIVTIHGFCKRMLHDNAFESGSLFDTELVTDQENIKREIVDDFWRTHFYDASPLFVNYAINNQFNPDSLLSFLSNKVAAPYLRVIPQVQPPDTSEKELAYNEAFSELSRVWQSAREEVEKILTTHKGLNRIKYGKEKIPAWIHRMDRYVASGGHNPTLFKEFQKFTARELQASMNGDYAPPVHPFFELSQKLKERQEELDMAFKQCLIAVKGELFHYTQNELTRKKEKKNIQSFDDLLLKLHRALEEQGGENLAMALRMKFGAALIDEFQDTDPIQYAIFKKVFGVDNRILFLIGDPKQAIYGFRGADIFTYLEAAEDVGSRHTLLQNWRSDPNLITAVNTLFANTHLPFVYDKISFQPAAPAERPYSDSLRMNRQPQSPLQLWFLKADRVTESGKAVTKTQARGLICKAVAAEISQLLVLGRKGEAFLGERPLQEGDIAVLVRTNAEARLMQEALSALHIPSVLYSTGNLFDSHEALEMERFLAGVSDPNSDRLLKTALATDMLGVTAEELDALMDNEGRWEQWLVKFRTYHDLWNDFGFIRMFRHMLLEEKILPRLMSLPDGERRNTNLLHLSEVLHQTSVEKKLGMTDLLKWLSEQRRGDTPTGLEEHPLRLESDENAVEIVTVHKSKGLEYPVVFCPFAWDSSRIKESKGPFVFHDEADNMRLTLDLGSRHMGENRVCAEKERLAENLRLLYVALTRAKSRCYLVWGRFNEAETSALAYLLHQPPSLKPTNVVSATGQRFKGLTDEDILRELKGAIDKGKGSIGVSEMPMGLAEKYSPLFQKEMTLGCRIFSGNIDRQWHISSFSSLVSGRPHSHEMADRDTLDLPDGHDQEDVTGSDAKQPASGIFDFPKGAKAGTFLHDLFEHLDFTQANRSTMNELVENKLKEYGFEGTWQETLCHMIRKVLIVPLDPDKQDLRLSRIRNENRLNELEFYFPLRFISPKKLKGIFEKYSGREIPEDFPDHIERLDFAPVRGFMKGFMDLVFHWRGRFYLLDWKSNFLGARVEDYGQESLAFLMKKECYILQYCIYALALDQYLSLRLPGYHYQKHFGGVFYIFLRGVEPEKGSDFGIYRDLPPPELINELRKELISPRHSVGPR